MPILLGQDRLICTAYLSAAEIKTNQTTEPVDLLLRSIDNKL